MNKKNRFTLYLTDEASKKFNELYAFRVMAGSKDTKSDILCKSLIQMHGREFDNFKKD